MVVINKNLNIMKNTLLIIVFLLFYRKTSAQSVTIDPNTTNNNNAIIKMDNITNAGIIIPRLTTNQRIVLPIQLGLYVFDIDTKTFWFHNGIGWIEQKNLTLPFSQTFNASMNDQVGIRLTTNDANSIKGTAFFANNSYAPANNIGYALGGFASSANGNILAAGVYGEAGLSGVGVWGKGDSFGGRFETFNPSVGTALRTIGKIQFIGIGETSGKVLTSDASGYATWQNLPNVSPNIGFYAHTVATNTIAQSTSLLIPFTATRFNDGSSFNINGSGQNKNKFATSVAGMYHFDAKIIWGTSGGTSYYKHELELRVENSAGNTIFSSIHPQNFYIPEQGSNQISVNVVLSVGDKVFLIAKHTSTTTLDLSTVADECFFSGYKVY
jgi:hypothetical protein